MNYTKLKIYLKWLKREKGIIIKDIKEDEKYWYLIDNKGNERILRKSNEREE